MEDATPKEASLRQEFRVILGLTGTEKEYEKKLKEMISKGRGTISADNKRTIKADVNRSLQSIYLDETALLDHRRTLLHIMKTVFKAEKNLQYTQGFHDVVSGLYLVYCNEQRAEDRMVYTCAEAARRTLRIYLLPYSLRNSDRMAIEAQKLYALGNRLVKSHMDIIRMTDLDVMPFIPALTTLGLHYLTEKEAILRTLYFSLSCGRYSPFYLCCSLIANSDIAEDASPKSVMLDVGDDSRHVMLSGLKYGYRPNDETETEYMKRVIRDARAMMSRCPPESVFNHVHTVLDQIPEDIDKQWNDKMDVESKEVKRIIKQLRGKDVSRTGGERHLSGAVIAGITIGVAGALTLLATGLFLSKKKRRH